MTALTDVLERIAKAATACDRDLETVELVAVSKQQLVERVVDVLDAGHRVFGENRVQEAAGKWPELRSQFSGVRLHLIGPLQTNKVKQALGLFDVIESVDRERLAASIAKEVASGALSPLCYIQVNTGAEQQKAGVAVDDAVAFVDRCRNTYGLRIEGLMAIPPADEPPAPHFALLNKLAEEAGLSKLSMGMSADFETAIEFGATSVRVGSRLFGSRLPREASKNDDAAVVGPQTDQP